MRTRDLDKQQRIKHATVSLILREGINGASVAKIAREAEVSPATIYVYYSNKEDMLSEVFKEYSHMAYSYLMRKIQPEMSAAELIESIIRSSFAYTLEHEEAFSFVEQCSRCPTLSEDAPAGECCSEVFDVIHEYQRIGLIRKYSDSNLYAVLFAPVKQLAMNREHLMKSADATHENSRNNAGASTNGDGGARENSPSGARRDRTGSTGGSIDVNIEKQLEELIEMMQRLLLV